MIYFIKQIVFILLLAHSILAQTNSTSQKQKWVNIGVGVDICTAHLNISANYSYSNHLMSIQYKNGKSTCMYSPLPPGTQREGFAFSEYQSLGATYGVFSKFKYASASAALGPVIISAKRNSSSSSPNWSAMGIMAESQLFLKPFTGFGVGLSLGHYQFLEGSFSSISLGIQFGL